MNSEVIQEVVTYQGVQFRATKSLPTSHALTNALEANYEDFLKKKSIIPAEVEVWIPNIPYIRMDWVVEGLFCMHETIFKSGCTVPFSPLACDVMKSLKLVPFQLLPAVWRMIRSIDSVCTKHNLEIKLEDLQNHSEIRHHGVGRFHFRVRSGKANLIDGLDTGEDKGWSSRYLFVKRSSVPGAEFLDYPLIKQSNLSSFYFSC